MPKIRVAIAGTVGKSVLIDTDAGTQALAAIETLRAQIAALGNVGSTVNHNALANLQVGDAHPQYTMWQANETIQGTWNFATVPLIEGETLAEYIEDVVGGGSGGGLMQDSDTVYWDYNDTAGTLEANVDQTFAYTWTATHTWTDNDEVRLGTGGDLRLYHDATNSIIRNDTGVLRLQGGANIGLEIAATGALSSAQTAAWTATHSWTNSAPTLNLNESDQGTDEKNWQIRIQSKQFLIQTTDDGITAAKEAINILRATGSNAISTISFGNTTDAPECIFRGRLSIGNAQTTLVTNIASPNIYSASGSGSGDFALAGTLFIQPRSSAARDIVIMAGSTSPAERLRIVGATAKVQMNADNLELQIGASQDLRLYHDGADSIVRTDVGALKLQQGSTVGIQVNSSGAIGFGGANYGTAGQIPQSNGSSAAVTWVAAPSGGGGGGAVGSLTYVTETVVAGAAATSIAISGLDLTTDECYEIHLFAGNATGSAATISMFYNADTTATNYRSNLSTDGGAGASANTADVAALSANDCNFYRITVRRDFDGIARAIIHGSNDEGANTQVQVGQLLWNSTTNVTTITFTSSVASSFAIGSKAQVWKLRASGIGVPNTVIQTSDLTITSNNSFQTTSLSASLAVGTYQFEIRAWTSVNATPDMEVRLQCTATVTNLNGLREAARVTTVATSEAAVTGVDAGSVYNMDATSRYFVRYSGFIAVSTTGTFAVYARQVTSSGTSVSFLAGSVMTLTRVL